MLNILDALRDPRLLGAAFGPLDTWRPWLVFLAALFGLPIEPEDEAVLRERTGLEALPTEPAREGWVIAGRRGGKSRVSAAVAVFLAAFRDYAGVLVPGERGVVMVLAADRRQAQTILSYVNALLDASPILAPMVEKRSAESIHLNNRISIEVHTSSYRSVRGYTLVAAICDEIAFWRSDESANPDVEVVNALRPGMATVPGALLVGISSPYARRGVLWDTYRRHYGKPGPVLVWKAPSRAMNPTLPEHVVTDALEADPAAAKAEYLAEFRGDIEAFLSREAVDACVVPDRRELPPVEGVRYAAFVDPSGGSSDSMTLAIGHREDGDGPAVVDLVREVRPPFSPESVVADFAETLKRYRLTEVTGDRYGAEWVAEAFRKAGLRYRPAEKPKSELYKELLPTVNSGGVELLDHPKLITQLVGLERRTARGGRDSIDHAPRAHDDLANVVAGLVWLVAGRRRTLTPEDIYGDGGMYFDENGNERTFGLDDGRGWKRL